MVVFCVKLPWGSENRVVSCNLKRIHFYFFLFLLNVLFFQPLDHLPAIDMYACSLYIFAYRKVKIGAELRINQPLSCEILIFCVILQ